MREKAESGRIWGVRCQGRECARRESWAWVAAAVRPSDDCLAGVDRGSSHCLGCLQVYAQQRRLDMGEKREKIQALITSFVLILRLKVKNVTFFTPTRLASEPPGLALMGALDRR